MTRPLHTISRPCKVLWLVMTLSGAALAQKQAGTQPAPAAAGVKGAIQESPAYVDGSFGFSLAYPDGSDFEREKRFITPIELEIVRFVHLQYTWSLALRLVTEERPLDPAAMLAKTNAQLAGELADLKVLRSEPTTIGTREGARLACTFKADKQDWLRQQAFIRKGTREYFVLIFLTPLADQQIAVTTFDRIVASFKILRSELQQQQLDAALQRGAALLKALAADPKKLRAPDKVDAFFRYLQNGKEIGFRHTFQMPREVDKRPGTMIQEWSWLFRDGKSFTHIQYVMFLANNLSYAEWDTRSREFIPAVEVAKTPILSYFGMEMGLYKDGTLLVDYTPTFGAQEMKEKAISAEPSFASPALFALLPQLLDLASPELYAFSAYDSDRRGLILRTYEVVGPTQVAIDGKRFAAIKLQDSEGLVPPINEIDVDPAGRILRAQAGPVELIATTQSYIEQTYKARVDEALKTLSKHPVLSPSLPRRASETQPQTPPESR